MNSETTKRNHSVIWEIYISAGQIAFLTLLSRVTGFLREVLSASIFGLSLQWDAFSLAFQITNLSRNLFGEGALSNLVIPIFTRFISEKKISALDKVISFIFSIVFGSLLFITVIGIIFSLIISEFSLTQWSIVFWKLFRILIIYVPLICITVYFSAILNAYKHFFLPALSQVLMNIILIGSLFYAKFVTNDINKQILILSYSVIFGGIIQLLSQIPGLIKHKVKFKLDFSTKDLDENFKKNVTRDFISFIIIAVLSQLNTLLSPVMAKLLIAENGAISTLYYANRLILLPISIIGVSTLVAFYTYAAEVSVDMEALIERLRKVFIINLFLFIYITILFLGLANEIVYVVFKRGNFSHTDVLRTALVLQAFSIGLWANTCSSIITKIFFVTRIYTPTICCGVTSLILNVLSYLLLVPWLAEAGIALGISFVTIFSLGLNLYFLRTKLNIPVQQILSVKILIRLSITTLLCVVLMVICKNAAKYFVTYHINTFYSNLFAIVAVLILTSPVFLLLYRKRFFIYAK